jgi:hypothetical protein
MFDIDVSMLFAAASLVISILAYFTSRRALALEQRKFELQERREREKEKGISLEVFSTELYDFYDTAILYSGVSITNKSPQDFYIRAFCLVYHYRHESVWHDLGLSTRFSIRFVPDELGAGFAPVFSVRMDRSIYGLKNDLKLAQMQLRDTRSKANIFSNEEWIKIEGGAHTYLWETITLLPASFIRKCEELGYRITSTEIELALPGEKKSIISDTGCAVRFDTERNRQEAHKLFAAFPSFAEQPDDAHTGDEIDSKK